MAVEWIEPDPRDDGRLGTFPIRAISLTRLCEAWKAYQPCARDGYIDTFHRAIVDEIVHRLETLQGAA